MNIIRVPSFIIYSLIAKLKGLVIQSPTTHPSSDGNSTTSHQSETKLKKPPPVRDDCWSEAATFTLIESWGDKILKLNSGSLRQQHWQEVADAVNARHGHVKKARRTDVQCKNRIDTLKKKFKVEKGLVIQLGSDNYASPWPFFSPLDSLIGSNFKPPPPAKIRTPAPPRKQKQIQKLKPISPPAPLPLPPPPSSVPVGRRSKRPPPPRSCLRRNFSVMAAAAAAYSDTSSSGGDRRRKRSRNGNGNRNRVPAEDEVSCEPYSQLAEAIGRFADVYARVEEAKQRPMVELEKQRMQFTKDLELERMKLLMESQVQLRKFKTSLRPVYYTGN